MTQHAGTPAEEAPRVSEQAHLSNILRHLRESSQFHDAVIVVQGHRFPVHRDVVSAASPFLATAFSGPYREARKASVTVTEATVDAMRVVVDYAYGVPFHRAKHYKTPELTADVYWLARHLLIGELAKDAGLHLVSVTQDSKLDQVYEALSPDIDPKVENELAHRMIRNATFQGVNTSVLDADFLLRLLESPDLIAAEADILRAILKWEEARVDVSSSELERLLSLVSFQRVQTKDLHLLLRFRNVPKAIWQRALDSADRPRPTVMLTKQVDSSQQMRLENQDRKLRRRNICRQTFALPLTFDDAALQCAAGAPRLLKTYELCHTCHAECERPDGCGVGLALGAHLYAAHDAVCLALTVDRRATPGGRRTLAEELDACLVHCALRLQTPPRSDGELFTAPDAKHAPLLLRPRPAPRAPVLDDAHTMLRMDKRHFVNPDGARWRRNMDGLFLFAIGY